VDSKEEEQMNIDEFRALKQQQETQKNEQPSADVKTEVKPPVTQQAEPVVPVETKPADKIVVDGEELTLDQIKEFKAGYSRTQDYTRKTQEAARVKREAEQALHLMNQIKANSQLVQQLGIQLPDESVREQERLQDQIVEREVELLTLKYKDFDVRAALEIASTRPGMNLEDAHLLASARKGKTDVPPVQDNKIPELNIEDMKKQIRQELLKELEANQGSTQSIISSNDGASAPQTDNGVKLTQAELDFCKKSKTKPEEYAKWKTMMKR
jgi:hypothetical protein